MICARFIPACAGNSVMDALKSGLTAVHPRVCGEQTGNSGKRLTRGGSSPRVRGTVPVFWC